MALTMKRVARLISDGEPCKVNDGRGLYLVVGGKANASWLFRYQIHHAKHWMGLGSALTFSLAQARERAQQARQRLADGVDPLIARQAERQAARAASARRLTFAEAAERWHRAMAPSWSSAKHAANVADSISKWAVPVIGKLDVGAIETADVMRVMQQSVAGGGTFWTAHPTTADRLRATIQQILDWSVVGGYRAPGDNPARWKAHLAILLPPPTKVAPVEQHPALPYAQVPALMAKLATHDSGTAQALRFMILTAARISEATGATWDEIDLAAATWTVPANRMKARREHVQPLAPEVVELLKSLPREDGNKFLFLGGQAGVGISTSAIRMFLRRHGHGDITAHGFRSSFATWAAERTGHANHAIELSLAHSVGNEVERAYRRGTMQAKRRRLMEDWGRFCTTPAAAIGDNVVAIGAGRSA
jgi:integrase